MAWGHCSFIFLITALHFCLGADQLQPVDLFGTNKNEWVLAFRGTAFISQSVYDAYLHGSENVDAACKQTTANLPCSSHYRSSILDNWKNIDEVAFVIVKYGSIQQYIIFDGTHTDNRNWFSANKLKTSSWTDLKGQSHNYFSVNGDAQLHRRFFVNHNYGGCDNDAGWFVAVDTQKHPCNWELQEAYPWFLYSTGSTYSSWTNGQYDDADMIGIYVKYKEPEKVDFVDLFGSGRKEWRIVFRGTSHINQPVYDAYLHGSESVDVACKQTDSNIPCTSHYRSSILDDWKDIEEVAFVIYKSGQLQKFIIFNGVGSSNMNWFQAARIKQSSWTDLKGSPQFFSIVGDNNLKRRFFMNAKYGGCSNDDGWFVAVDQKSPPCGWEHIQTYPLFLFSNSTTHENWSKGKVAEADVIAVFVKFGAGTPGLG